MASPILITMLTYHDKTVANGKEIFLAAKDAPCMHWGFKDVGLPRADVVDLVDTMKAAGKTTYLECLAFEEESALRSAELAVECGFDVIMGTFYFDSVGEYALSHGKQYFPFFGDLLKGILYGTIEDTVKTANELAEKKVTGVNLCGYRYVGDADKMICSVAAACAKPVYIAGSVDSYAKIDTLKKANISAFTIGGAFFEHKFGDSFAEQITAVEKYLAK